MGDLDLSLLGLEPGKVIWGQLGKAWWPGRVSFRLGQGCRGPEGRNAPRDFKHASRHACSAPRRLIECQC